MYGFNVKLKSETGGAVGADEEAVLVIEAPLPPGALMTVWGDDERFVKTYLAPSATSRSTAPLTGRHATRMVTTSSSVVPDDVINVAGHRLGTREIEEVVQAIPLVAECAVVGVADQLKGRSRLPSSCSGSVAGRPTPQDRDCADGGQKIGAIARPGAVHLVTLLPKTRSGKLLRRSIQALAEGRSGSI